MDKQLTEITVSGETFEEALEAGLQVLGVARDMVDVDELSHIDDDLLPNAEPLEGMTLRLRPRMNDIVASAKKHLTTVLELMGIKAHIEKLNRPRGTVLNILAREDNALIIGKQGQNLEALQYLINRMATHGGICVDSQAVIIDSEGYYEKHYSRMEEIANRAAKRILREDRVMEVVLPPMSSADRRLIHLILRDVRGVHTISRGEGPMRHIVVTGDRMEVIGSPLGHTRFTKITIDQDSLPPAVAISNVSNKQPEGTLSSIPPKDRRFVPRKQQIRENEENTGGRRNRRRGRRGRGGNNRPTDAEGGDNNTPDSDLNL